MAEYRHSAHAVFDLKYHLIWCTKYRKKVLRGQLAEACARDLIRQICAARDVVIVRGAVSPDHIHLLLSAPPILSPAKLAQYIKGRSSRHLQAEFVELPKQYWGQHMWARGYFCARWAPWMRLRSNRTSRSIAGTKTTSPSRLRRPPRLEPACEPGTLQAASPATRLSVATDSTGFSR